MRFQDLLSIIRQFPAAEVYQRDWTPARFSRRSKYPVYYVSPDKTMSVTISEQLTSFCLTNESGSFYAEVLADREQAWPEVQDRFAKR